MKAMDSKNSILIAFKASPEDVALADALAATEGATRAGVARRFWKAGLAGMFANPSPALEKRSDAA
jgi:hypothetical protein